MAILSRHGKIQIGGGVLFGLALFAFAVSQIYIVSLIMLLAVGFASQIYLIINRASLMLYTEKQYFGRVTSIYMMTWSLMPLSLLPMGFVVDQIGVSVTVALAGLTLALFIGGVAARFPDVYLRRTNQVASTSA